MFQSKEKRDTFLLIVMLVVTVLFILYQFFPLAKVEPVDKKDPKPVEKKVEKTQNFIKILEHQRNPFPLFNSKIVIELNDIYRQLTESNRPFEGLDTKKIRSVLEEFASQKFSRSDVIQSQKIIHRALKLSFIHLPEYFLLNFPDQFDKPMRFNIFLSLFLIKLNQEEMVTYLLGCSDNELRNLVNFEPFRWIGNEIAFDYQTIPFLFYFRIFIGRNSVYPRTNVGKYFLEQIDGIRDLSDKKHLMEIRNHMEFYQEEGVFRVEWEEYDRIGPNDKKKFPNLPLQMCHFLNQVYLIFPDDDDENNNLWISELTSSDVGKIELIKLLVVSEDPMKDLYVKELIYTDSGSRFMVILKKYSSDKISLLVNRIIENQLNTFHKNFNILNYTLETISPPLFKKELEMFGEYLQKRFENQN